MYYILKKNYFYNNTINAPENGPIQNAWGKTMTFPNLENALSYLLECGVDLQLSKQTYTTQGYYSLKHGEYDRPDYQIRKSR